MTAAIIKQGSLSFSAIESNIDAYLKSLTNYEEIKDLLPASNLTLVKNLMSGFGTYIAQRQSLFREETYLSTAKMATSVYNIANVFGYAINRYTSPSIKIKYNEIPTITLVSGDILGSYNGMDIVYFGPNKVIEKLDLIDVYIGHYSEIDSTVSLVEGSFNVPLIPELLVSVDRDKVQAFLNDVEQDISQSIEDYIVLRSISDYSTSPYSTKLFVSDMDNSYGIIVEEGQSFKVKYMETNGFIENIKLSEVTLDDAYFAVEVNHNGTNGDSLEKIRRLAPLLYSTLRRMVTELDHRYIAEAHPFVSSCAAERDLGQPYYASIDLTGDFESDTFTIVVIGITYTYTGVPGDTKVSVTNELYTQMTTYPNQAFITTIDTLGETIYVTSSDARKTDFEINGLVNATLTIIDENVKPACCTVNIYYVNSKTISAPIEFTEYEKIEFSNYLNKYKMVGLKIILVPATVNNYSINIKIQLTDPTYYDAVVEAIDLILAKYELNVDKSFNYGTFLVEVSNIKVLDVDGVQVSPLTAVIPNQTIFNIIGSKYAYSKFTSKTIILE